jgi:hypothetical protein
VLILKGIERGSEVTCHVSFTYLSTLNARERLAELQAVFNSLTTHITGISVFDYHPCQRYIE